MVSDVISNLGFMRKHHSNEEDLLPTPFFLWIKPNSIFVLSTYFLIVIIGLGTFQGAIGQEDSISYYDSEAELFFLKGETQQAIQSYQKALDNYWRHRNAGNDLHVAQQLKLIEKLAVTLRQNGDCELALVYLQNVLQVDSEKKPVALILHEIIKCNNAWGKKISSNFQEKILDFFKLSRIDEAHQIQLNDLLNGAQPDEEAFNNFFYLLENGFVPALGAMDQELESERRNTLQGWIILSSLFIIAILGFVLYSLKKRKEFVTKEKIALLEGKVKESDRLSIDLHDILGYKIVELKDMVKKTNHSVPNDSLKGIAKGLDELHESMRYIVQSNLTPESLKFGIGAALDTLINRVNSMGVLRFKLYKHGLDNRLETNKEKHIFYLIQELVNNVIKHSKGRRATIEVTQSKEEISIIAEDDGIGYHPSVDTLKTVKARTAFLNGTVIEDSQLDHGTTIIINIPV